MNVRSSLPRSFLNISVAVGTIKSRPVLTYQYIWIIHDGAAEFIQRFGLSILEQLGLKSWSPGNPNVKESFRSKPTASESSVVHTGSTVFVQSSSVITFLTTTNPYSSKESFTSLNVSTPFTERIESIALDHVKD
mmetsp:Transcript_9841/g.20449  ORF Transcript_9841/g.20449 Transcript_9841/m.20449 type:complete len:135 (-) Transcript_9841:63-467(-)